MHVLLSHPKHRAASCMEFACGARRARVSRSSCGMFHILVVDKWYARVFLQPWRSRKSRVFLRSMVTLVLLPIIWFAGLVSRCIRALVVSPRFVRVAVRSFRKSRQCFANFVRHDLVARGKGVLRAVNWATGRTSFACDVPCGVPCVCTPIPCLGAFRKLGSSL